MNTGASALFGLQLADFMCCQPVVQRQHEPGQRRLQRSKRLVYVNPLAALFDGLFNRIGLANVPGTLGVSVPGVEVGIFPPANYEREDAETDAAFTQLADDEPGEICVRGANVAPGYLGDVTDEGAVF